MQKGFGKVFTNKDFIIFDYFTGEKLNNIKPSEIKKSIKTRDGNYSYDERFKVEVVQHGIGRFDLHYLVVNKNGVNTDGLRESLIDQYDYLKANNKIAPVNQCSTENLKDKLEQVKKALGEKNVSTKPKNTI